MSLKGLRTLLVAGALAGSAVASATPAHAATTVPSLDHVFVIVMENHSYPEIIGSSSAPYINSLAAGGGLGTGYMAASHPSLPNYLALVGGSTYGITSDCTTCWISAANIGDRVESAGKTWKAYVESMPSPCYVGDSYPYAQKHNPFVYFNDIRTNSSRCQAHDVPYTQLGTDLQSTSTTPAFGFITPNMCNDMHDCSVATGDSWLQSQVPAILNSPAFKTQNSLLAITWDEDDGSTSNNHVPVLFLGPAAGAGARTSLGYNHYSLLHTVEVALGLSTLTTIDAGATPMADLFASPQVPALCTSASIGASPASPALAGTPVTWTAASTGCVNPLYRFWEQDPGAAWRMVQDYSTSNTLAWTAPATAGTYRIEADVRDAGETVAYDAVADSDFAVQSPGGAPGGPCAAATLSLAPAAGATGVAATMRGLTATCPHPEYRFWVKDPGRRWSIVQNYSASATHMWAQTGSTGAYELEVDVRDASETVAYDSVANVAYSIAGCSAVSMSPNMSSPQAPGTQVTFSATATCPGTPSYRFWIRQPGGAWQIVWDYSSDSGIIWTPPSTAGTYYLEVDVRDQGAAAAYETVYNTTFSIS
ncbi:MAG TPA: alkaline phosphatase family protein [Candidatus Dormibacteraeota bacterium]|nr:alkaline phosphatase family protein [Candidatus Dormibacteraeota bacterium]